jgi:hypothetical protein
MTLKKLIRSTKINYLLLVLVSFLGSCSSNNVKDISLELPKNSIGSDRLALSKDMLTGVDLFIQRNLECTDWSLVEVIESKAEGQMVFTSDGQIYRGSVSEKWSILQCGKKFSLDLEITNAPNGGSLIRIKNL